MDPTVAGGPFWSQGFGSRSVGTINGGAYQAPGPAVGGAFYTRVPRAGVLRNWFASVQYASATAGLTGITSLTFTVALYHAPNPGVLSTIPTFSGPFAVLDSTLALPYSATGAFLSDFDIVTAFPVSAGDYIVVDAGVTQVGSPGTPAILTDVTVAAGVELF